MGNLRVVSNSETPFVDRREAGRLLGEELKDLRGQRAVVLGVPRGGVVVAQELARTIDAVMDIVLAHKLRTPGHPELALGSVAEDGKLFLDEMLMQEFGVTGDYIRVEKATQMAEMARRTVLVRQVLAKIPLAGRIVVVTDDGVATGATTKAALWAVRQENPKRLIAAIPVGALHTIRKLTQLADELICLRAPLSFSAVGQFYNDFSAVEDSEMLRILRDEASRKSQS